MENKEIEKDWYFFDAKDQVVGRFATNIANILRGKNKPTFLNNTDNGDFVVIINAEKFALTGKKMLSKRYYKHSGYIGNLKTFTIEELMVSHPEEVLRHAIEGMLPQNKLAKIFMNRLKIYAGETHPHQNVKFKNQG